MDSEAESDEQEEEEASEDSESGVASLALATTLVSKSILNSEEKDLPNTMMTAMRLRSHLLLHGKRLKGTQISLIWI